MKYKEYYLDNNVLKSFYKPIDWIDFSKLNIYYLYSNPNAIHFFEEDFDVSNLRHIAQNFNAIDLLEKYKNFLSDNDKILICKNECAIDLIKSILNKKDILQIQEIYCDTLIYNENEDIIKILSPYINLLSNYQLSYLFSNKYAVDIIKNNLNKLDIHYVFKYNLYSNPIVFDIINFDFDKVCWNGLAKNENKEYLNIIRANINFIKQKIIDLKNNKFVIDSYKYLGFWRNLCGNIHAMDIIKENLDQLEKQDWSELSKNPSATFILQKNKSKIDWNFLCLNPNGIDILKNNKDKINYNFLALNPSIFTIDYDKIKNRMKYSISFQLHKYTWNPNRFQDWCLDEEEKDFLNNLKEK